MFITHKDTEKHRSLLSKIIMSSNKHDVILITYGKKTKDFILELFKFVKYGENSKYSSIENILVGSYFYRDILLVESGQDNDQFSIVPVDPSQVRRRIIMKRGSIK